MRIAKDLNQQQEGQTISLLTSFSSRPSHALFYIGNERPPQVSSNRPIEATPLWNRASREEARVHEWHLPHRQFTQIVNPTPGKRQYYLQRHKYTMAAAT